MAYLAVDKNGSERIYDFKIERFIGKASEYDEQVICYDDIGRSDFWTMKSEENFPKLGKFNNSIELPKGSIEKLIGRKLTWDDEPVEI